jgi:hypothetical protein
MSTPKNRRKVMVSLGELVAVAFDEASRMTGGRHSASQAASQTVASILRKSKREDVLRRLGAS